MAVVLLASAARTPRRLRHLRDCATSAPVETVQFRGGNWGDHPLMYGGNCVSISASGTRLRSAAPTPARHRVPVSDRMIVLADVCEPQAAAAFLACRRRRQATRDRIGLNTICANASALACFHRAGRIARRMRNHRSCHRCRRLAAGCGSSRLSHIGAPQRGQGGTSAGSTIFWTKTPLHRSML